MTIHDTLSRIAFIAVGAAGFSLSLYRLRAVWIDKGQKRYWMLAICTLLYIPIAIDNLITNVLPRRLSFALVLLIVGIWFVTYYSIRKKIRENGWDVRDRSLFAIRAGKKN